jgi:hypothetical protein
MNTNNFELGFQASDGYGRPDKYDPKGEDATPSDQPSPRLDDLDTLHDTYLLDESLPKNDLELLSILSQGEIKPSDRNRTTPYEIDDSLPFDPNWRPDQPSAQSPNS